MRTHAQQQTVSLFDHHVGASEHRRREVEVDHLGGLEVDYKPILGWRLHRQVGESRTSLLE